MSRFAKLLDRLLAGRTDRNFTFEDLMTILFRKGFTVRVRGDHHIFRHPKIQEIINLQPDGALAKRYQVEQVRKILIRYDMTGR